MNTNQFCELFSKMDIEEQADVYFKCGKMLKSGVDALNYLDKPLEELACAYENNGTMDYYDIDYEDEENYDYVWAEAPDSLKKEILDNELDGIVLERAMNKVKLNIN